MFHFCIVSALLAVSANAAPKNWRLLWADEFNSAGRPDTSKWNYEEGYQRNKEAQYYTRNRSENARVENGNLVLEARRELYKDFSYTSASLTTKNKAMWTYGRVEVRAQLPTGVGLWPAIWMLGSSDIEVGWPACGEIDIMENVGYDPGRIHANIHTTWYNHQISTGKGSNILVNKPYANFHLFALEWSEDSLSIYYDDRLYFTYKNDKAGVASWPFDHPFYLILNIAVGGSWGSQQGIDTLAFPQKMLIDYVRVFKSVSDSKPKLQLISEGMGKIVLSPDASDYTPGSKVQVSAVAANGYQFYQWRGELFGSKNPITVIVENDMVLKAIFRKEGELVVNGDFEKGLTGWNILRGSNGALATGEVLNGIYQASVTQKGANWWDAQFSQNNIFLTPNTEYELSFDAWSLLPVDLVFGINQTQDPWGPYYRNTISLNTSLTKYTFKFAMKSGAEYNDNNARIEFNMAGSATKYYLDNISLKKLGTIISLKKPGKNFKKYISIKPVRSFDFKGRINK